MKLHLTHVLAACAVALIATDADALTLNYDLRPIPRADRTELEVTLRWRPEGTGPQEIGLPQDCYGTPNLHESVASFVGRGGTQVATHSDADKRIVTPGRSGEAQVRYVLSYDPEAMSHAPFGPNTSSAHFHIAGCQYLLRIGDAEAVHTHTIRMSGNDRGWRYYSSLSADPRTVTLERSYDGLNATAIGGSSGPYAAFDVDGRPLQVFWSPAIALGDLGADVERIVRHQRRAVRDNDFPFYTVAIWPRPGVVAGTAISNLFVAFMRPDVDREAAQRLLAHEMFHNWLGARVAVEEAGEATGPHFAWLHEGVNEYLSRRMLQEQGVLSEERMVELTNRDLSDVANNPYAANTVEELEAAVSRWTNVHAKLAYARGAVIGLRWDIQLRARGGSATGLVRALHAGRGAAAESISRAQFFEVGAQQGVDIRADYERYIVRGEPIDPPADAFPGRRLETVTQPRFDPGFDVTETLRQRAAAGVREGGPAWNAGLRDGMAVTGVQNAGRFSNAWSATAPFVVVREGGQRIEFMPHGAPIQIPQYVRG